MFLVMWFFFTQIQKLFTYFIIYFPLSDVTLLSTRNRAYWNVKRVFLLRRFIVLNCKSVAMQILFVCVCGKKIGCCTYKLCLFGLCSNGQLWIRAVSSVTALGGLMRIMSSRQKVVLYPCSWHYTFFHHACNVYYTVLNYLELLWTPRNM